VQKKPHCDVLCNPRALFFLAIPENQHQLPRRRGWPPKGPPTESVNPAIPRRRGRPTLQQGILPSKILLKAGIRLCVVADLRSQELLLPKVTIQPCLKILLSKARIQLYLAGDGLTIILQTNSYRTLIGLPGFLWQYAGISPVFRRYCDQTEIRFSLGRGGDEILSEV
jgi:hypothetical protein